MMAIFSAGITQAYVTNNAQAKLVALRNALEDVENFYQWLSNYALTDLEGLNFNANDGQQILNAFADANAMYQIYNTGQAPSTYPQVTSPYTYATSQRLVIGPLS
jgi:hypothetical protein